MILDVNLETPALKPCATVDDPFASDLTFLLHRAQRVLAREFDIACREFGLKDMRDTLVLAVAADGIARTQIEIATILGLDKTTLSAIIDRLVGDGFIERTELAGNRRSKIPVTTPVGEDVLARALQRRDELVADTMVRLGGDELMQLRTLLWKVATA